MPVMRKPESTKKRSTPHHPAPKRRPSSTSRRDVPPRPNRPGTMPQKWYCMTSRIARPRMPSSTGSRSFDNGRTSAQPEAPERQRPVEDAVAQPPQVLRELGELPAPPRAHDVPRKRPQRVEDGKRDHGPEPPRPAEPAVRRRAQHGMALDEVGVEEPPVAPGTEAHAAGLAHEDRRKFERDLAHARTHERQALLAAGIRAHQADRVARAEIRPHAVPGQRLGVRQLGTRRPPDHRRRLGARPRRAAQAAMVDAGERLEEELVASATGAQAPLDVLVVGEVRLVEEADAPE